MSALSQQPNFLSLTPAVAQCRAYDRHPTRLFDSGLRVWPGGPQLPPWHSQVWKGVRSGRERAFLRVGNDFSISSFKIIFPKLEVT